MTIEEKAEAFDAIATALTNQWFDGSWSWWNCCPCGGATVLTKAEAVADLVAWAERTAKWKEKRNAVRVQSLGELHVPGGQKAGRVPGDNPVNPNDPGRGDSEGGSVTGGEAAVPGGFDSGTPPTACS